MSVLLYSDQPYCQHNTVIGYNIEISRKKSKSFFPALHATIFTQLYIKNDGLLFKTQPLNLFHQLLQVNYYLLPKRENNHFDPSMPEK